MVSSHTYSGPATASVPATVFVGVVGGLVMIIFIMLFLMMCVVGAVRQQRNKDKESECKLPRLAESTQLHIIATKAEISVQMYSNTWQYLFRVKGNASRPMYTCVQHWEGSRKQWQCSTNCEVEWEPFLITIYDTETKIPAFMWKHRTAPDSAFGNVATLVTNFFARPCYFNANTSHGAHYTCFTACAKT